MQDNKTQGIYPTNYFKANNTMGMRQSVSIKLNPFERLHQDEFLHVNATRQIEPYYLSQVNHPNVMVQTTW